MMTYEEYQRSIVISQEAMKETRRLESKERKELEEERLRKNQEAFENYCEFKRSNNELYQGRMKAVGDKYKAERMRLHIEHARVVEQWREQHGINCPPHLSNCPQESGLTKEEPSDDSVQD